MWGKREGLDWSIFFFCKILFFLSRFCFIHSLLILRWFLGLCYSRDYVLWNTLGAKKWSNNMVGGSFPSRVPLLLVRSLLSTRESSSTFFVFLTLTSMESRRLSMPWLLSRVLVVVLPLLYARRLRSIFPDGKRCIALELSCSAGELSNDEIEKLIAVITNPLQYNIPEWFLNRQKDIETGKYKQIVSNNLQANLREDLNRLKKMRWVWWFGLTDRANRGLRHYWNLKVRGQHTKTTGRFGKSVGVSTKK